LVIYIISCLPQQQQQKRKKENEEEEERKKEFINYSLPNIFCDDLKARNKLMIM
jgi:hypothetical protein